MISRVSYANLGSHVHTLTIRIDEWIFNDMFLKKWLDVAFSLYLKKIKHLTLISNDFNV